MTQEQEGMLATVYAARGYLVVVREIDAEVGSVIDNIAFAHGELIGQKMRVVAETTMQDFNEQQAFWGSERQFYPDYKFYRVEGD